MPNVHLIKMTINVNIHTENWLVIAEQQKKKNYKIVSYMIIWFSYVCVCQV